MIHKLSSIKFSFYNLSLIIILLGAGICLSQIDKQAFKILNQTDLFDGLVKLWIDTPILVVWLVFLCVIAAALFVNTLCCSFSKQMNMAIKSKSIQKWLFFILHCIFIVVLASHGFMLFAGSKLSGVVMFPGECIGFENKYKVEVSNIFFSDDINILKADRDSQRKLMTRKNIHRKSNYATISLFRQDELLKTKEVIMLSPLRHRSVQVTITDFIVKQKGLQDVVGIRLTITNNALNTFFFIIYGAMITTLGLYILLTPKKDSQDNNQ